MGELSLHVAGNHVGTTRLPPALPLIVSSLWAIHRFFVWPDSKRIRGVLPVDEAAAETLSLLNGGGTDHR